MAYIDPNDKLLDPNDPNKQLQSGQQAEASTPMTGAGSSQVGNTVSTAGVGAGGTGGWTNIQSYLQANSGDTGSAKNLQDTVGGQFDKESSNLKSESDKTTGQAKSQVDSQVKTQDAGQILQDAAKNYNYSGQQAQGYNDQVGKVRNTFNPYGGPTQFNYSMGADTQKYGSALGDRGAFDNLMTDIYSKKAGNPLSQGQYQLQKQLDVNNSALEQAKGDLTKRYSGLGDEINQGVTNTQNSLNDYQNQYRNNQSALQEWLGAKQGSLNTDIGNAETQARNAIRSAYDTGSGLSSIGYDTANTANGSSWNQGHPDTFSREVGLSRAPAGLWGTNQTYRQLENEDKGISNGSVALHSSNLAPLLGASSQTVGTDENGNPILGGPSFGDLLTNEWNTKKGSVANFWNNEQNQYGNTADEQKRQYNTLLDFLNTKDPRRTQGFNVKEGI